MAARFYARERDIPDPIGYEDLAHDADASVSVMRRRLALRRAPMVVQRFPLPKRTGLRPLTVLDPYDDLLLRILVGRVASPLQRKLTGSAVMSYPLLSSGAGWRYESHRIAARRRRDEGHRLLSDPSCAGIGTTDVTAYYPSVDLDLLEKQLAGTPPGAASALISMLRSLPRLGGAPGLPIGFEGSGLLGNVCLLPADEVWGAFRVGLIRWTDDCWWFLRSAEEWVELCAAYASALEALGLKINAEKSGFFSKDFGFANEIVSNGRLDSITGESSAVVDPEFALELVTSEISLGSDANHTVISFGLGCLRRTRPHDAVDLIRGNPVLWEITPKATGDLLLALTSDPQIRRSLDPDWIVDYVTSRDCSARRRAGQVHAARALSKVQLGATAGEKLHDAVVHASADELPVAAMAAHSWSKSDHWKPGRAVDAVLNVAPFPLRRAVVAGFRGRSDYKKRSRDWEKLRRVEPDLEPTLGWAAAA